MKMATLALSVCLLGMALLAASWIWKTQVGEKSVAWSEEEAQAMTASASRLHQMTYEHAATKQAEQQPRLTSASTRQVSDGDLAAARDDWQTRQQQLADAQNWFAMWTNLLFYGGVVAVISGGFGYFCAKNMSEE